MASSSSSSSLSTPPSISSFRFSMIGKEPDLLKRISAPQPNQDYQGDATSTPASHSPVTTNDEVLSRLSLLQKLAPGNHFEFDQSGPHGDTPVTPSQSPNHATGISAPKPISPFDPICATLFHSSTQKTNSSSVPAPNPPSSCSDMELSPQSERDIRSLSVSNLQAAPQDMTEPRSSSTDSEVGLELAYPPTNPALSRSPEPPDPSEAHSIDIPFPPLQELPTRLMSYIESKTIQQSKLLDAIASLERDIQAVSNESSLVMDIAERAGVAAENSLKEAKDSMTLAQQSFFAAKAAKIKVDHAVTQLVHLRRRCEDEHSKDVQDRADLMCSAASLERGIETYSQSLSEGPRRSVPEPSGLGHEVLCALLGDTAKLARNRQLRLGLGKRKRDGDQSNPAAATDTPPRPSKEARREQPELGFDKMVEMEAEAAREAWVQEVERRSAVPPDPILRVIHDQHVKEVVTLARTEGPKGLDAAHNRASQKLPEQDPAHHMVQPTVVPSVLSEGPPVERTESSPPCPNNTAEEGLEITEEVKAQRQREIAGQKLEIANFHMRERDSQEKGNENVPVSTELQQTKEKGWPAPAFVSATPSPSLDIGVHNVQSDACDVFREKGLQLRLKQRASPSRTTNGAIHRQEPQPLINSNARVQGQSDHSWDEGRQHGPEYKRGDYGAGTTLANSCANPQPIQGKSKEQTNSTSSAKMLGGLKETPISSVGNVTAKTTLAASTQWRSTTSPVKQRAKNFRTPQTSTGAATEQPSLQGSAPISSILSTNRFRGQHIFPQLSFMDHRHPDPHQDMRSNSLPPIECIAEPDQAVSANRKKPATTSSTRQKAKQNARKVSPALGGHPSHEADIQPSGIGVPPAKKSLDARAAPFLRLPTDSLVPKVEVISPTLTQPPGDQFKAQTPRNIGVQPIPETLEPVSLHDTPAPGSVRPGLSGEVALKPASHPAGGSNVDPMVSTETLPPPTAPSATVPVPRAAAKTPLSPADSQPEPPESAVNPKPTSTTEGGRRRSSGSGNGSKSTLMLDPEPKARSSTGRANSTIRDLPTAASARVPSSHSQPTSHSDKARTANDREQRLSEGNNSPTSPSHTADHSQQLAVPVSGGAHTNAKQSRPWSYNNAPARSPPRGRKRPRDEVGNMDGRHWSPGQESRGRVRPRTVSGSPPLRSQSQISSRPLHQRLGQASDPDVFYDGSGGQSYRPSYDIHRPLDEPALLHRFTEPNQGRAPPNKRSYVGYQPLKRSRPMSPGGAGGKSLEQRIS